MVPVCRYIESGTVLNNYAHIFDLLIRLRQAVNHPYLVVYSASGGRVDAAAAAGAAPDAEPLDRGVCGLCGDPLEDGVVAACGHAFCRVCVTDYLDYAVSAATPCPVCDKPLTVNLEAGADDAAAPKPAPKRPKKTSILSRIDLRRFQSSTKLEALHEEIDGMRRRDASAKCIVFSQFTSMLDLAQFRLQQVCVLAVPPAAGVFSQFTSMLDLAQLRLQQVCPSGALHVRPLRCVFEAVRFRSCTSCALSFRSCTFSTLYVLCVEFSKLPCMLLTTKGFEFSKLPCMLLTTKGFEFSKLPCMLLTTKGFECSKLPPMPSTLLHRACAAAGGRQVRRFSQRRDLIRNTSLSRSCAAAGGRLVRHFSHRRDLIRNASLRPFCSAAGGRQVRHFPHRRDLIRNATLRPLCSAAGGRQVRHFPHRRDLIRTASLTPFCSAAGGRQVRQA